MDDNEKMAEIEKLTIGEFRTEVQVAIDNLKSGIKPANTIELLAMALNIGMLGEDLKATMENWLQLDLWKTTKPEDRTSWT